MDRSNHYETAFEAYLQGNGLGYIAVDESRRPLFGDQPLKSLDFLVFGAAGNRFLVDVKGRRFPAGPSRRPRRVWENWSTRDDIDGLERWTDLSGYQGLLVFAYDLQPTCALPDTTDDLWTWRGRRYLLRAISAEDYRQHMRVRSPRWRTVSLPHPIFRRLVRPLHCFTRPESQEPVCPF